jgi:hypothetical protein
VKRAKVVKQKVVKESEAGTASSSSVTVKSELAEVTEAKVTTALVVGPLPSRFVFTGNKLNGSPVDTGRKFVGAHVSGAGELSGS